MFYTEHAVRAQDHFLRSPCFSMQNQRFNKVFKSFSGVVIGAIP